jgi:hypothetical protein
MGVLPGGSCTLPSESLAGRSPPGSRSYKGPPKLPRPSAACYWNPVTMMVILRADPADPAQSARPVTETGPGRGILTVPR